MAIKHFMGQLAIYNQFYSWTNYIEYDRKGYSHHGILNKNMSMTINRMNAKKNVHQIGKYV